MTTRAAIYSRFSSDLQKATSIDEQVAACEQHAKRMGWQIAGHYDDKAISGATDDRPGYQRMREDAKAGKFDILIALDVTRLARNLQLFLALAEDFRDWGRRLVTVADGQDSDNPTFKLMSGVLGSIAEHFRDSLAGRVRLSIASRAKQGLATGGRIYGYQTVTLPDGTKRRAIHPEEAEVVKRIFTLYASGELAQGVAARLNEDGVATPRGALPGVRQRKSFGWTASTVAGCRQHGSGILNNRIYIGEQRWNTHLWKKRKNGETEGPKLVRVPLGRQHWITTEDKSLVIIDAALWEAVKDRQAKQWAASENMRARQGMAARTGRKGKFLLSGILKCGTCGENLSIRDGKRYACGAHFYHASCPNDVTVSRALLEQTVLGAIKGLFSEEAFELFKSETRKLLAARRRVAKVDVKAVQAQLRDVETKIKRINQAIEDGHFNAELGNRLDDLGSQKKAIEATLRSDPNMDNIADILPRAAERFQDAIAKLGGAIPSREMSHAKQVMAALVGSEIVVTPTEGGGASCKLQGHYQGLVQLVSAGGWKMNHTGIPTSPR